MAHTMHSLTKFQEKNYKLHQSVWYHGISGTPKLKCANISFSFSCENLIPQIFSVLQFAVVFSKTKTYWNLTFSRARLSFYETET